MKFVAIDFETANYKRSSICQIGVSIVEEGKIVQNISRLVKPTPNYYESRNTSIHGITSSDTEDCPTFNIVWKELNDTYAICQYPWVAHNASFDMSAFRAALELFNINFPSVDYYCTVGLSKLSFQGLFNYRLDTVSKYLNINLLNHHDAKCDAQAAAEIMLHIMKHHDAETVNDLIQKTHVRPGQLYEDCTYQPFSVSTSISKTNKSQIDFSWEPESIEFDEENPFYQKTVAFTGALSFIRRNDARQKVINAGGYAKSDSVTKKTNFLVIGSYDYKNSENYESAKFKKAKALIEEGQDLEIISEKDFFQMIHFEGLKLEITLDVISKGSSLLLNRNKFNDLSGKNICFTLDHTKDPRLYKLSQAVGYCSGHYEGLDYVHTADYIVVCNEDYDQLLNNEKTEAILQIESSRVRKSVILISEKTLWKYLQLRERHIMSSEKMHIHEREVQEEYRRTFDAKDDN